MKLDALDHPKTFDFAARLGIELPTAIGHLELLWAFTGKQSPQGDIGKWPDGSIARACYWMGDPAAFMRALQESGFVDHHPEHRALIHDWPEHAPRWVRSKLKTLGKAFISPDVSGDVSDDVSGDTKGREGKSSEVKGREAVGGASGKPTTSPTDVADESPVVLTFRTTGKQAEWHLRQAFVDELSQLYPQLDPLAECKKAHAKIEAGAVTRKTANGMKRFLFSWMDRGTNGKSAYAGRAPPPQSPQQMTDAERRMAGGNSQ